MPTCCWDCAKCENIIEIDWHKTKYNYRKISDRDAGDEVKCSLVKVVRHLHRWFVTSSFIYELKFKCNSLKLEVIATLVVHFCRKNHAYSFVCINQNVGCTDLKKHVGIFEEHTKRQLKWPSYLHKPKSKMLKNSSVLGQAVAPLKAIT